MSIENYILELNKRYSTGISTEHTFRADLQNLIQELVPDVLVTNEPTRIKCGAPDYIITKRNIPIGYIEAKDIGKDLNSKEYKDQFNRYRKSLPNLIITDYLTFRLYVDGELVTSIQIGEIIDNTIHPLSHNFEAFKRLLKDFCTYVGQTIRSSSKLSKMMANKARLLSEVIEKALTSDEDNYEDSSLKEQMNAFKDILIHDITPKDFADIYAQTIAYGMFAARLHDPTLDDFSRHEAAELIPKSNPFLRKLFQYIAGYDLDDRIVWIVDALADIFRATDVKALLNNFGKSTQQTDPIIHFYETFLAEYDPKLRKSRGVWYTPEPVVNFIVRAVDDILKEDFNLSGGLGDTTKTKVKRKVATNDKRSKTGYKEVLQEVHKVQILDPATGTGTFLAEVVKQVYKKFEGQQGIWSNYVENHLIPRLNGFEILMASYSMAHLKLELLLQETGYKATKDQRFKIYLTNSLEEHHKDTGTLFASWLSSEANEANHIKRDTPVMCVIGNPPYAVSSNNKSDWILNIINDYKKDLKERKINLDDDYIKFIRYGQYHIDKTGEGVLAYISNNSFIDGVTHRQMRKHLLGSFDKVYIIDLHGSAMKNETTNPELNDENVFDIMQGVSINIFVKTGTKKKGELAKVYHYDLYGKRNEKYPFLQTQRIKEINWVELINEQPYYFFVPKDFESEKTYKKGFKIDELFKSYVSGFQTKRDKVTIAINRSDLDYIRTIFNENSEDQIRSLLQLPADGRDWKIEWAKKDLIENAPKEIEVMYRPFDNRYTFYTGKSKGFVAYPRAEMLQHLNNKDNFSLVSCRQQSTFDFQHVFISRLLSDMCNISSQTKETGYIFPLYVYSKDNQDLLSKEPKKRIPNLCNDIVETIAKDLKLPYSHEKEKAKQSIAPMDILDYIYSILHSPTYRMKYKEFLKIDFPRIPYPKDKDTFWRLVKLGSELRQIHLLESSQVEQYITTYPEPGSNMVTRKLGKNDFEIIDEAKQLGRIWLNETQYFDGIPLTVWNFYIGGYQPAQKWLKDRRERELSYDDILHYQKIIVALAETDRLMKEIDKIDLE